MKLVRKTKLKGKVLFKIAPASASRKQGTN